VIPVEHDYARLRCAAGELLEESLAAMRAADLKSRAARGANIEELLRRFRVERTLGPGYYARAAYLFELDQVLGEALSLELRATQLRGVLAIRAAREGFERRHPSCPHCARPLDSAGAIQCWSCKKKVKG